MARCERCAGYGTLHRQDCGAQGLTVGCPDCGGTGGRDKCQRCDNPIKHRQGDLCATCIADDMDYDENAGGCANCGGEGFTYGCDWDWQCDTWDGDSCLCARRCEWCNPVVLTPEEKAERDRLRDILATALAKDKIAELRSKEP